MPKGGCFDVDDGMQLLPPDCGHARVSQLLLVRRAALRRLREPLGLPVRRMLFGKRKMICGGASPAVFYLEITDEMPS